MLVTDSFVFLHVPKTGGTFVKKLLLQHMRVLHTESHTRHSDLSPEWQRLPGFYIVRDPWDWYVSWYSYAIQRGPRIVNDPAKREGWEQMFRSGEASFTEAVERACATSPDLYSRYLRDIVPLDRPDYTPLKFERLRKDLRRYLRPHMTPTLREAVRRTPRERVSDHQVAGPYTHETYALVRERTSWLQDRFGYHHRDGLTR